MDPLFFYSIKCVKIASMSENKHPSEWKKALQELFLVGVVILIFFASVQLAGAFFAGKSGSCKQLNIGFTYETEHGETGRLRTPIRVNAVAGERVTVRGTLPENIENGKYIAYYPYHQFAKAYIDGELRDSYKGTEGLFYTNMPTKGFRFVPVSEADAGLELVIVYTATSDSYAGELQNFYYGDKKAVLRQYYKKDLFVIICGIILFGYGFVMVASAIGTMEDKELLMSYLYLGETGIVVGFWFVLQSGALQMVCDNAAFLQWAETMTLSMFGFPLLRFVNICEKNYYRKLADNISVINLVVCLVTFMSFVFGYDMLYVIWVIHLALIAVVIFVVASIIGLRKSRLETYNNMRWVSAGVVMLGIFTAIEAAVYYRASMASNGSFLVIGMMTFMFAGMISVQRHHLLANLWDNSMREHARIRNAVLENISHAIHWPMREIFNKTEEIASISSKKQTKEFAAVAHGESVRTLLILDGIIDYLKLSTGVMSLTEETYESLHMYRAICRQAERFRNVKSVDFVHKIDRKIPRVLEGDKEKIQRVLRVLLALAFNYTRCGKVEFEVGFNYLGGRRGNLIFTVKDSGEGLPQNVDASKLFVMRKHLETAEGPEMTLAVTGEMVRYMNGSIRLEETGDDGIKVVISIPQVIVDVVPVGNDR